MIIVSRMEMYEWAAAMPSSLTYRQSVLLGCIFCTARASSLPLQPICRFEHLPIRWGNTSQRNGERQTSFGIGEPICGLEESQNLKDCERSTGEFSMNLHEADCKNYLLLLWINFVRYIFVVEGNYENILTMKISRSTVLISLSVRCDL